MAKRLYIIRHAKSDWSFEVRDFDRPLNDRGFRDAPQMAERLLSHNDLPQQLISSPAKRALTTAQIFAETLRYPNRKIELAPQIYDASAGDILKIINNIDNQYETVAIFGHNPGLSDLVERLVGTGESIDLPTCAIAYLQFDTNNWQEISGGIGNLRGLYYPKDGLT